MVKLDYENYIVKYVSHNIPLYIYYKIKGTTLLLKNKDMQNYFVAKKFYTDVKPNVQINFEEAYEYYWDCDHLGFLAKKINGELFKNLGDIFIILIDCQKIKMIQKIKINQIC